MKHEKIKFITVLLLLILFQQSKSANANFKRAIGSLNSFMGRRRFADGRPKAPDSLLGRLKLVTLEEAWALLRNENYRFQYADGWQMINPDSVCASAPNFMILDGVEINEEGMKKYAIP